MTTIEEKMLRGEFGRAVEKSMQLLIVLGEAFGAEALIPVDSVQISGVSYQNIGDAGLEYLEDLARIGGKVSVNSTLNPAGIDILNWKEMKVPGDFAEKQTKILEAYESIGATPSCTCTPYIAGNLPRCGQHIAWAESSAVVFANSVVGAYTNREGGPSALASAITGRTPFFGYHLEDERQPTHLISIETQLDTTTDYSKLGYYVGKRIGRGVPLLRNLHSSDWDNLKALSAGLATSGGIAMFLPFQPNRHSKMEKHLEKIAVDSKELDSSVGMFSKDDSEAELVCVGCPHFSPMELNNLSKAIEGRKVKDGIDFWVCTSGYVAREVISHDIVKQLSRAGVRIVSDTCFVASPLKEMGYRNIVTNSCKGAHYLSSSFNVGLRTLSEIVRTFTDTC
ncbi:MAG: aconitase X catalytic domain-containing protein [Candidatus Atabeyarchaeum deiterrae]